MPLTDQAIKKTFGNIEPQQRRDYTGPLNSLLYEAYATPGISEDIAGWVIIKHTVDANGYDLASQPKYGLVYTLRNIYNYDSP